MAKGSGRSSRAVGGFLRGHRAVDLGHGVPGIWAVIAATAALRGVAIAAWFSRGTWKHRTV